MKVLHVISGGDSGGAKTHVLTLLEELKKDIDISLLCVMNGVFTKEAEEKGIKTKVILQKNRFDIISIYKMKKFILNEDFDLIHFHGARANYIATILKILKLKKPFVTTVHSDYLLDFSDQLYKKIVYTFINVFSLKRFKYFLTVTDNFKNMLIDRGFKNKRIFTIYNGIDVDIQRKFINREDFLKEYNLEYKEDHIYVGLCARLNHVKGVRTFINAAEKLKDKKIIFLVAGSGEEKDKYLALKKDKKLINLHFLGHVSDIFSFYNAIDINTLTSLSESFPYALLEGGIMKKPTIASRVGGIPEMIKDKKDGFLFEKEDSDTLSKLIIQLSESKELRELYGGQFSNKVRNKFSKVNMKDRHIEIYKTILNEWR